MEKIETLNYSFWKYFKEISAIPRKSGEEYKIAQYLINFAQKRKLKYYKDKINNVIIWKNATTGKLYSETLGLQCHTDMICEKKINTEHDFSNNPLMLYIDKDFIKAKNTTLGADNGIGIAYILAILDANNINTPNLECIFTTQEETTMDGAKLLDSSILKSKKIISFDNFSEDEMWISSATAEEWEATMKSKKIELDKNKFTSFKLMLKHFKGGHSGLDISDNSRGNPIKIIAELLSNFSSIYISNFEGGSKVNIIPRNCQISFAINNYELSKIQELEKKIEELKKNFISADFSLSEINNDDKYFDKKTSNYLIEFINGFKNGGLKKDNYNNTILSGNFAAIKTQTDTVSFLYSIRYNDSIIGKKLYNEIEKNMQLYNIYTIEHKHILGYEQNENSKLINTCSNLYYKYFNKEIKKVKVQACLECGYFAKKIKDLQFIAIAPNIYDAHSPSERMSIKSANRMWGFIEKLVEHF